MSKRKACTKHFHCSREIPIKHTSIYRKEVSCPCGKKRCTVTEEILKRVLEDECKMSCYSRHVPRNVQHVGQLKLLLSEIEFLMPYKNMSTTLIYAGAAPGIHIPRLACMFPSIHFILIDPNKSIMSRMDIRNCSVLECEMTETLAAEFKSKYGTNTLFVSDVRIGPESEKELDIDQQTRIHKDMLAQMQWFCILDPMAGMFKFRLPWDMEPDTEYLEGHIHLPVFGRFLTHESRLIVQRGAKMKMYNNKRYEGHMAYFNQKLRIAIYPGGRCYDCTVFKDIIRSYMEKSVVDDEVDALCLDIEQELECNGKKWADIQRGICYSLT